MTPFPLDDETHASVLLRPDLDGFLYRRELGDRLIAVMPLRFGGARLGIGPKQYGFDDVWDYPSAVRAVAEARTWDPDADPEPAGWDRHPGSGRRRLDGDPTKERKPDDEPGNREAISDDDPGSRDREESA